MPVRKTKLSEIVDTIHSHHINYDTREIYLHGAYSSEGEPGVEYRMATTFVKNLHILQTSNKRSILVHEHSIGGEWGDGMGIFNSIQFSKCPVAMLVYAQASSMSGVILQAADKRVMLPDSHFMLHHGSIHVDDNSMAAKAAIESNEKACKRMLNIFAIRAKVGEFFQDKKTKQIEKYIDDKIKRKSDWYLDAEETVYYGFADGILGEKGFESIDKIRTCRKFNWKRAIDDQ